ncbi:MAG TPA: hypothetical protein PKZ75_02295 [Bacteroidia bacterium]|nr:hypothetical protein [Bacteroidia bacterium]
MKKLFFTLVTFILIQGVVNAQSFKFGTIAADAGVGGGLYGIRAYSPVNNMEHFAIGAIGTMPRINAEFGIAKFFGVGVSYRRGTYGKSGTNKLRGSDVMVRANFHVANKNKKFDLPIGIGYGLSNFNGDLSSTEYLKAKGGILNVHVSPHFYFGNYIGMFLSLGYNKHLYNQVEAFDGSKLYTEADGATWKMGGVYFEFGISGRFHLFNRGEEN